MDIETINQRQKRFIETFEHRRQVCEETAERRRRIVYDILARFITDADELKRTQAGIRLIEENSYMHGRLDSCKQTHEALIQIEAEEKK